MIKGFFSKPLIPKQGVNESRATLLKHPELRDTAMEDHYHRAMLAFNLRYDEEEDYYFNQLGAFMINYSGSIQQLIENYPIYKECAAAGCVMAYGPAPLSNGDKDVKGIYCTNYLDIMAKQYELDNENIL